MFDMKRMEEALNSDSFRMPVGLKTEQKGFLIKLASKDENLYRQLESLGDENMKASIKELMYDKKQWDSEILTEGGFGYYHIKNLENRTMSEGKKFKKVYRVSMCKGEKHTEKLKWRIKSATGEVFSVTSKSSSESQLVVDELFGKGKYQVSQMLV